MKMRKVAAAFTILALIGGAFVCMQTENLKKDAHIYEETLAGNPAAADGLAVNFGGYLSYGGLSWENSYTYGSEQNTEFLAEAKKEWNSSNTSSISADLYTDFSWEEWSELFCGENSDNGPADQSEIEARQYLKAPFSDNAEKFFTDLKEEIPNNMPKNLKIRVQDVLKYYIIGGDIQIKENMNLLDFWMLFEYAGNEPIDKKLWSDIQAFFKIPVLENEYALVSVQRDSQENAVLSFSDNGSSSKNGADSFRFSTVSCATDEAVYFTFDAHTTNGNLADTSLIPGGYGIYRLPYDSETGIPKTSELEMIYSLDPEMHYGSLHASPDGKKLFLTYYNEYNNSDDIYSVSAQIIDIQSRSCDELLDIMESTEASIIWPRDDGEYLLFTDASQLRVYRYENGRYEEFLYVDELDSELPGLTLLTGDIDTKILYEDGMMTTVSYEYCSADLDSVYHRYTQSLSAVVNVFKADGHAYCGRLYSNLQDYYDTESGKKFAELMDESSAQARGTFMTDTKFPTYMQRSYESLGIKRAA